MNLLHYRLKGLGQGVVDQLENEPDWLRSLKQAIKQMPQEYSAFHKAATKTRHLFLSELGAAVENRLNPHVKQMPQYSLDEKRQLAYRVNDDLRSLNLCFRCPTTGLPAILIGDYIANPDKDNRFRFEVHKNGRQLRKGGFRTVPELKVIEAPARVERMSHRGRG
jgi:hypothetical protein